MLRKIFVTKTLLAKPLALIKQIPFATTYNKPYLISFTPAPVLVSTSSATALFRTQLLLEERQTNGVDTLKDDTDAIPSKALKANR